MDHSDWVEQTIQRMNLWQKVGQMLTVGFPEPFEGALPDGIGEMIARYRVGGVGVFARNAKDPATMKALTVALQNAAVESGSIPLLLLADQESGVVMQVTGNACTFPGQMALGASGKYYSSYDTARIIGLESRAVGLNLVCAPVLDVNRDPDNAIIGVRSFGEDPMAVAELGKAMIRGYQDSGIPACAKHFPGHGSTKTDTHLELPVLESSLEELEAFDLAPFEAAIDTGVAAIMTAHICFPELAPDGLPATLSPGILTGLLRHKMGFDGVIITDCLEMKAIQNHYGTVPAAVAAVKAGADILLICHTAELQQAAIRSIYESVRNGEIEESRIDQSVRRILYLKSTWLRQNNDLETIGSDLPERIGSPDHRLVEQRVAREAITLVRNEEGLLPLAAPLRKLALIYPKTMPLLRKEDLEDSTNILVETIRARCAGLEEVTFQIPPTEEEIAAALAATDEAEVTLVCTSSKTRQQEEAQGQLVNRLLQTGMPVVTIAMRNPYDLRTYPGAKTHLATYGYRPCSIEALAEVLFGEIQPSGKLPVSIPGVCQRGTGIQGF